MAVSVAWIRENMFFASEQYERQLTEAELKVQRSLQKLSIPDWYLNKRSNPPKIINVTPIECRAPSWKKTVISGDTSLNSTSSTLQATVTKATKKERSPKSSRPPKSPETRYKKSLLKAIETEQEKFDTSIPPIQLPTNISKTFPKMSPSRKIQNINLVFPPGPRMELSGDVEDNSITQESKYKTFIRKKQPEDTKKDNNTKQTNLLNQRSPCKSPSKKKNNTPVSSTDVTIVASPNMKELFKIRTTSTPKSSSGKDFLSVMVTEIPKMKKIPSQSILEKSSIFENSFRSVDTSDSFTEKPIPAPRRKISQNLVEKTSVFENNSKMNKAGHSLKEPLPKSRKASHILERNMYSIEPILFEKADKPSLEQSFTVRDIVKRIEVNNSFSSSSEKSRINIQKKNTNSMVQEKVDVIKERPAFLVKEKKTTTEAPSPCTRFMHSKRKSTDLENVVKSKQLQRQNSRVKNIIEILTEKLERIALSRQDQNLDTSQQSFVKKVVKALEEGGISMPAAVSDSGSSILEEDSYSESDGKSYTTSASAKDTDSSDSDQRSESYKFEDDQIFNYETLHINDALKSVEDAHNEDDSVYWIPVSRCKLPRTSSLLSMMSRVSLNMQSPCVSPIRCESDTDIAGDDWEGTYKENHCLPRTLFRIDETIVLDSGYSERSALSSEDSFADSTWSEDTLNDSGPEEITAIKVKRSSRRKSIIGQTFCIR